MTVETQFDLMTYSQGEINVIYTVVNVNKIN